MEDIYRKAVIFELFVNLYELLSDYKFRKDLQQILSEEDIKILDDITKKAISTFTINFQTVT